jgi:hypothetical protein
MEDHAELMCKNRHLPDVGSTIAGEAVNVGD